MLDFYSYDNQLSIYEKQEKVKHVRSSVNLFLAEKDPEKQMKSYLNMLSVIEGFIVEEQNKENVYYVIDRIIGKKIYEFIPNASKNIVAVIQTLRILPQLEIYSRKAPPPSVLCLFGSSFQFSSQQKQLIQLSKNYFSKVFSMKDFLFQFENNYLIEKLWPVLTQKIPEDVQNYILQTFRLFKSKSASYDEKTFSKFVNIVDQQLIPPDNAYFASKFICTLYSQFSTTIQDITTNFINSQVPKSLETLFQFLTTEQKREIIKNLLEIDFKFFKWLDQICSQNKELQDITFDLIIEFIFNSKSPSIVHTINQSFPLKHWFTDFRRPLTSLTSAFQLISEHDPKEAKELIEYLFKIMDTDYLKIFNLIYKLVNDKKVVTFKELSLFGYLQSFVIKAPSNVLKELFSSPTFESVTREVFKKSDNEIRFKSFKSMFNSQIKIEILSRFLNEVPSVENIRSILVEKGENMERACYIFCSLFEENALVCDNFIVAGGLQWLEKMNDSYFVNLLSCLVKQKSYEEVDNYINSLPKDHKIFSLPSSEIEKIVYGMNKMKFRPIRVSSLFYLLPPPSSIDPYNAYILGKSDYASNGYDCPLINQIGNRYIKPQYISILLSKKPYEIRRFVDTNYDHFPLFQFFTGIGTLRIQSDFLAISFWVKFHQTNYTSFFETNLFKLVYDAKSNTVKTDNGTIINNKALPEKWNHIFVYLEHTFFGDKVIISINGNNVELSKISSPILKVASIEYSGNGVLFVGSTIFLFKNYVEPTIINQLLKNGPGYISSKNRSSEIITITPYQKLYLQNTEIASFPSNCYAVPYFGFPFHFISQKRLSDLFILLDNSRTEEQFDSIFHTLITINEITIRNTSVFWQRMVRAIKNTSFIKDDYIHEAVRSVVGLKNDEWTLSFILFDNELWKCVNNETLVRVLFDEFQNTDFSLIQEFELLMTNVVLQNPENNQIIDIILQNSINAMKQLVKWIISFLGTAHCIDGIDGGNLMELISARCETKVQHTIIDSLKSFIKQDNIKFFLKNGLSFETLCGYVTVSAKSLSSHFIDLITEIEKINPGYIEVSDIFITAIAPLASFPNVWINILELTKMNSKFIPLLLSLVWATTISIINALSINDKYRFKISDHYEKGLLILIDSIPYLYQSKKCMSILNYWFPLIFYFPIVHQLIGNKEENSDSSQSNQIRLSSISMDEIDSANISSYVFMIKIILSVFNGFGLEPPKSSTIKGNYVVDWLQKSNFLVLLSKILIGANNTNFMLFFPSFILSFPFFNSTRGKIFIPTLFESILLKIDKGFPYMKTVLDYSIFAISEKCFLNCEYQLLNQLFIAMKKLNMKEKCCDEFITMFIGLFDLCSHSTHQQLSQVLFSNLQEFKNIIISSNSQLSIFYVIYLISKDRMFEYNMFIKNFSHQFSNSKDKIILDFIEKNSLTSHSQKFTEIKEAHSTKLNEFKKIYKSISNDSNKTKFITEINDLSTSMTNFQNKTNHQCCDIALDYKKEMKVLESSFLLIEERLQWDRFMTSIHDLAISESSFYPRCYHLSPRCLPLMVPQVLTPSPYQPFIDKKKKNSFSQPGIESSSSAFSFLSPRFIPKTNNLLKKSSEDSFLYDSNSNFFKYFDAENSEDEKKNNKSFVVDDDDDDISLYHHHGVMNPNSDKNILLDQTFTNEASVFVDQRKVSTYTQDLGITSSSSNELSDFFSSDKNSKLIENEEETEKNVEQNSNLRSSLVFTKKPHQLSDNRKCVRFNSTMAFADNVTQNNTFEDVNDVGLSVLANNNNNISSSGIFSSSETQENEGTSSSNLLLTSTETIQNSTIVVEVSEKPIQKTNNIPLKIASSTKIDQASNSFTSDIIWQYRHHVKDLFSQSKPQNQNQNFFELFKSVFGQKCHFKCECKLVRHASQIPSIVFIYDDCLLILTYSTMKNNDIELKKIVDDKELHIFLESVFLGHWGETKMFASHIVLNIPISSLIRIKHHKQSESSKQEDSKHNESSKQIKSKQSDQFCNSFEFWSLMNGNFIIKVDSNSYKVFSEKLKKISESVDYYLPKDLFLPYNSPEWIILFLNDKYGRSFADLQKYPFFPSLNKKLSKRKQKNQIATEFPNVTKTKEMLSSVLPFAYSSHHYCNESNYESFPANFYFTPEFIMKNSYSSHDRSQSNATTTLNTNNNNTNIRIDSNFGSYNKMKGNNNNSNNNNNRNFTPNKFQILNKKRSAIDSQRKSKNIISFDFSIALQKLLKLREGLRDIDFLNDWINHHFPDVLSDLNINPSTSYNSYSNNNNLFYANIRASYLSSDMNNNKSSTGGDNSSSNTSNNSNVFSLLSSYFSNNNNSNMTNFKHKSIIDPNTDQISQKLKIEVGANSSIQFSQEGVKEFHRHSFAIRTNWSVEIQPENLLLCFSSTNKKNYQMSDHYFAFASSINISNNGLFLCVDFVFGLTRIWRIKYNFSYPCELEQMSDFSWSSNPTTLLSGTHFICATKLERQVVLWDMNSGTLHHILRFGTLITSIAMDDEFGGIWIATLNHCYYYTLNGQRLSEIDFKKYDLKVTAMSTMPQNFTERDRTVICGCDDGKIFIGIARIQTRLIDVKILPSQHLKLINRITIHPSRMSFLSSDVNGNVFIWSSPKEKSVLGINYYEECGICRKKPDRFCESCGRAICTNCVSNHRRMCILCHAQNVFVNL